MILKKLLMVNLFIIFVLIYSLPKTTLYAADWYALSPVPSDNNFVLEDFTYDYDPSINEVTMTYQYKNITGSTINNPRMVNLFLWSNDICSSSWETMNYNGSGVFSNSDQGGTVVDPDGYFNWHGLITSPTPPLDSSGMFPSLTTQTTQSGVSYPYWDISTITPGQWANGEIATFSTSWTVFNTYWIQSCSWIVHYSHYYSCNTKIYRGGVCEESTPLDTIYNRPGRRGLSITCCEEEEFCVCSSCDPETTFTWSVSILPGSDPDFTLGDLVASGGTGDTFMLKVKDPCTEHCPDELVELEVCVDDGLGTVDCVIVTIGRVAIGLGTTNAHPNTQTADVELLLWNTENHVRALQTDICGCEMEGCSAYTTEDFCGDAECAKITDETQCGDADDCQWKIVGGVPQCVNLLNCAWVGGDIGCVAQDNMVCTECMVDEDRTPEYICSASEQANGCCRVTLYSTEPEDLIQQGSGAVARIKYDILGDLTSKDCICLWPFERKVSDQFNEVLCAVPKSGEICFMICGDVYPQDCYECSSCGDGVVDLFDILEEIDIILGLQTATECQKLHGDVPLGMPPYCGNPAGVNPPNCETDGIIDIFDALVIIDKALGRMNCCDYCMFGKIY